MSRTAELDGTLAALAEPTRRAVVDLLRTQPQRPGEMCAALQVGKPALSRHLKVLREQGLVEELVSQTDARQRVYQLRPEPFAALRSWLDEVEDFWQDQLASFKRHAERKRKRR